MIALCALVLNVTEYRSADAKLKRLAQQVVESQENERARLSRELHDGISQMMVSVKLLLESALARFERSDVRVPAAEAALTTSLARLGDTLREVRRISHALRPSMLDDLGVAAALEQLYARVERRVGYPDRLHADRTHPRGIFAGSGEHGAVPYRPGSADEYRAARTARPARH